MTRATAHRLFAAALSASGLAVCLPAHAQLGANPMGIATPKQVPQPAQPAPAPALPGSRPAAESPAPLDRLPSEMSPTEALFDAINRGDLGSARDAVARGAELNGKNVLGLTPLELSVDLGRNEISFLLLSMRGSIAAERPPVAAERQQAEATPAGFQRRRGSQALRQFEAAPGPAPVASNGGTPVPSAGFLGFDIGNGREH